MSREKGNGQAKRLILWSLSQKIQRVIFILLRHMNLTLTILLNPVSPHVTPPKIKYLFRKLPYMPLPNVTDKIAIVVQEDRKRLLPRSRH